MLRDILLQAFQEDDDLFDFPLFFQAAKASQEVKEPRISKSMLACALCLF